MSSSSNNNNEDVIKISRSRLINIVFGSTILIVLAFLYLVYKPDNLTLLNIMVALLIIGNLIRSYAPDTLEYRVKKLEEWRKKNDK